MKIVRGVLFAVLVLAFCLAPAGALRAHNLTIAVQENGDARVDFNYELTWIEQAAVFTKLADPGAELKSALENNFVVSVDVIYAGNAESSVFVHSFASVKTTPEGTVYTTPALSFENAQRALNNYWFAPLVSPDLSPDVTRVVFPDGYSREFTDQIAIPSITHTTGA
ncbi:MAG: hypothetical protein LUQ31_02445 [Methanoregula sp.]|nr:hypothetical protein [Methanoregula sp.]